jgi:hypothetical protein
MRTFVVGRSQFADISIADATVARRHLEIVLTDDGRLYITDCATESGSWRWVPGADSRMGWQGIRQAFVDPAQRIRLGAYECTPRDLLRDVSSAAMGDGPGPATPRAARESAAGPVERDPMTGEIIRKRL